MNSKQNEAQPWVQAGWSREALRVAGEVGVLHRSVDLWESITHGERREGTCVDATKRSDGVVTAGSPGYQRQEPPETSTPASARRRKPTGKRHSESRVRENRMHGLMRGGKQTVIGPQAFQPGRFPPTLRAPVKLVPTRVRVPPVELNCSQPKTASAVVAVRLLA